jgi:hypothetical protein
MAATALWCQLIGLGLGMLLIRLHVSQMHANRQAQSQVQPQAKNKTELEGSVEQTCARSTTCPPFPFFFCFFLAFFFSCSACVSARMGAENFKKHAVSQHMRFARLEQLSGRLLNRYCTKATYDSTSCLRTQTGLGGRQVQPVVHLKYKKIPGASYRLSEAAHTHTHAVYTWCTHMVRAVTVQEDSLELACLLLCSSASSASRALAAALDLASASSPAPLSTTSTKLLCYV